jgi:MOSC domain-containing protein YiiM
MWRGRVVSIHVAPTAGAETTAVPAVRAVAGAGLEGDRYFQTDPEREVTLVAQEVLEALLAELGLELRPGEHRRNVVTAGVPLNDLVGEVFQVGAASLRGVELCEPCRHLERLAERPGLLRALVHRGGLGARIVRSGRISVGDPVTPGAAG